MTAIGHYIVESDIDNWGVAVSATCNFNPSDVNLADNKITVSVVIATGSVIIFTSTGMMPTPLIYEQIYYAIKVDATHIKVATNPVNAAAGTAVDLTSQGSGVHTVDVGEGSSTVERQAVIDRAEQLIESITDDYFYNKPFVATLDGNDKDRILVGLSSDVLSVSKVEIFGVELPTDYWTFDNQFVYLDPEAAVADELAELHLRMKYQQNLFPEGVGNIKITGICGWTTCPPAVKKTTVVLCKAENDPTLYQRYGHFDSERVGDYSYSKSHKYLTGVVEADRLLTPYLRSRPMLGAI